MIEIDEGDEQERRREREQRDGERLGAVEPGRVANLTIATGDVLQATTRVVGVFVDGRPYEPASKQTRLYDKYRKRLDEAYPGRPAGGGR